MKRRNFIYLTTAATAGIALPVWYFQSGNPEYNELIAEPEFLSHIWDTHSIQEIGEKYRQQNAHENSERKLVNVLSNDNSSIDSTTKLLRKQIQKDFKAGRTVIIDGWILSVTEARQCALFSLTNPK